MVSRRLFLQSSVAAAITGASGLHRAWAANAPGVTESEIKIGQTFPYSGPASGYVAIARAEAAYFKMINEKGGATAASSTSSALMMAIARPRPSS